MISLFIGHALQKAFSFRGDGFPTLPYWDEEDLKIQSTCFTFRSGKWLLSGKRYFDDQVKRRGVAIFFHGLGGGALSYTKQIAFLAHLGYLVYAYDNTGSGMSQGENIVDLTQCLLDQKAFFAFLDQDEEAKGQERIAMGHSWGGFAALASLQEEYRVKKVVSISGFLDLKQAMIQGQPSVKKIMRHIVAYQRKRYGEYAGFDVLPLLKSTKASVLYVGGEKDQVVPRTMSYDVIKRECPQVKTLLMKDRGHNPYWTVRSCRYFDELLRKEKVDSFSRRPDLAIDRNLLNETDPSFEKAIIDFLSA